MLSNESLTRSFRVAVPNKGSLSEATVNMLLEAGYTQRKTDRQLVLQDRENDIEFFYLRPRDIAVYVGSGTIDAGITGLDLLYDAKSEASLVKGLGFAKSTFRFARPAQEPAQENALVNARPTQEYPRPAASSAEEFGKPEALQGKRIATSYPNIVQNYLNETKQTAEIVRLDGAIESSIDLGVADVIADVVSTGTTLKQAGLQIFGEPILESEAVLIRSPKTAPENADLAKLTKRLEGVITAREYVLMDYDIPNSALERAIAITPGIEGPTVSPIDGHSSGGGANWSAIRVMVKKSTVNVLMDDLHEIGARAILVTAILASRL